jgi:hypothetical protein
MEVENTANALMAIYRKAKDATNVQRVAKEYGAFYMRLAQKTNSSLAIGWLMPVVALYEKERLDDEADEVRLYMEDRGSTVAGEMRQIGMEIRIEKAVVDAQLDELLAPDDLFLALFRASYSMVPKPDDMRKQLERYANECPIVSSIPRIMSGSKGMPVAKIGPAEDDQEGRLVEECAREIHMNALFFESAWVKAKEKFCFTAEELIEVLKPSILFEAHRKDFFEQGFAAFEAGDYVKSIHVLVPQVENMMRMLLKVLRVPTTKSVRNNPDITELKNLSEALNHRRVKETLEEGLWLFLKVLYTDKRGYNLRNEVAHGIASLQAFNKLVAGQVIQSIILLSALRPAMCYMSAEESNTVYSEQAGDLDPKCQPQ